MSPFNDCKPFNQTSETAVRLMLRYPWFMGLYYSMHIYECRDMPMKTLATNGTSIWVDPDFWAQLTRDQRMTAVAHEMGHKMLYHCSRLGERHPMVWNMAGDHLINHMLVESGFAPLDGMVINGKPFKWLCDKKYSPTSRPQGWTTEQVYDDLMDEANEECKKQTGKTLDEWAEERLGAAKDMVAFGETPDGDVDGSVKETVAQYEQRVRGELKTAEQMAKLAGNCPNWMARTLDNADHIKVNWWDTLEQYLKSLVIADYSWSRFNRREFVKTGVLSPDMWQPAMGGIKVYIDASGSCWDALGKFNKHTKDVWEQVKPKWVEVSYFQTEINHQYDQRFERGDYEVEVHKVGGGGTSFQWLTDDLDAMEEKPEVCLFLTDMYGAFPTHEPNVPVLWISVSAVREAPFGEVINVN